MIQGLKPGKAKRLTILQSPSSLLFYGYQALFPQGKLAKVGNCTSSSSAQVKNEWGYASAPHMCLQGMHIDYLTFLLYFIYQ